MSAMSELDATVRAMAELDRKSGQVTAALDVFEAVGIYLGDAIANQVYALYEEVRYATTGES